MSVINNLRYFLRSGLPSADPNFQAVVRVSAQALEESPLKSHMSADWLERQSANLNYFILQILGSKNPVLACREALVGATYQFARYQVIVLPPEPEEDITGLRGQPGITGGIKEHLLKLAAIDDELKVEISAFAGSPNQDEVWDWCLSNARYV